MSKICKLAKSIYISWLNFYVNCKRVTQKRWQRSDFEAYRCVRDNCHTKHSMDAVEAAYSFHDGTNVICMRLKRKQQFVLRITSFQILSV